MAQIRFHLDENVNIALAEGLRRRGIDVTTPADAGFLSFPDEDHLAFAVREARVLVTHDADFLRMHRKGRPHPGIVFCAMGTRSVGEMFRALTLIAGDHAAG